MSEESYDRQRVASKRESNWWWVGLGARLESRQHLGGEFRETLLTRLREASGQGEAWVFEPCIQLGLHDEAWQAHQAGGVRLLKVVSDFYASILFHDLFHDMDQEVDGYARWLLGYSPRSSPDGVTGVLRSDAANGLGWTALHNTDTLQLLLEEVHRPDRIHRFDAIEALYPTAVEGKRAALITLLEIVRDPVESSCYDAIHVLSVTARTGRPTALRTLAGLAQDPSNRDREGAIVLLGLAGRAGHEAAVDTLAGIALDQGDNSREAAIEALTVAASGWSWMSTCINMPTYPGVPAHELAVETLVAIALDRGDSSREAAIRGLKWPAKEGHQRAKAALRKIKFIRRRSRRFWKIDGR